VEASLKDKLNNDLKQAMKSGETTKRDVIRLVLAAVNNAETAKKVKLTSDKAMLDAYEKETPEKQRSITDEISEKSKLTDAEVIGIIQKEFRQRQESITAFKQGNRLDLASKEEEEMKILQAYLPQQASRDEILEAAKRIITETGARGPADKGKVMPRLIAEFKGKADGRDINAVVSELLK
jgi:uncharacterized protein YqeY